MSNIGAIYFLITMITLLALSVPVGFTLGISGLVYAYFLNVPVVSAIQRMAVATDSFTLLAIPLFILAGNLMSDGGIAQRLIRFIDSLIGWVKGGLAIITIVASAFFGAICGSTAATAVAIGSIMIPGMKDKGYDHEYATSVVAAAAPLGAVIPPSLIMVTYGALAGVSVTKLFMGSLFPGIIITALLSLITYLICKKKGYESAMSFSLKNVWKSFKDSCLSLLLPLIVLGGIYGGVFTPTEAAAIAVTCSLIISVFVYKTIKPADLPKIILESAKMSAVTSFLVCTASLCGWTLALGRIPQLIADGMTSSISSAFFLMLIINVLLLIVGCFMESIAALSILTPILYPLAAAYGIDPLHFGVIVCINITVGTSTPPFGVNFFVTSGMTGLAMDRVVRKAIPLLLTWVVFLLVVSYVPAITTFLPNLMG
jgi:C4-dicarboxylate transporter DctM subunit